MADEIQERVRLNAEGEINKQGKFEVDAITAGEGNGWLFNENCLRESLALWDNVECFVDHGSWFDMSRSVKDLGGIFHNPRWSDDNKAIRVDLTTLGPNSRLVEELGRQIINEPLRPRVGFSADVLFTAKNKEVQKILRVFEIDLV